MTDAAPEEFDPALYREVMGHYPTGVTVVTGFDGDEPLGIVIGTFTSVSLDPPLVAFLPMRGSTTYARLSGAPSLCINVLAQDQLDVCRVLAGPDPDKFERVRWKRSPAGAPEITDAVAYIHCRTERVIEAGDHWIVLCRVTQMRVDRPVTPLLFFQGGYGGFTPHSMAAQGDAELLSALRLGEAARSSVDHLAQSLGCEAGAIVQIGPDFFTTAVSSYGGQASMAEHLGLRLPLMPPIGEVWVADADPATVERWLDQALPQTPETRAQYQSRLDKVVQRGASIATIPAGRRDEYDRLQDALREYGQGHLTPARERTLKHTITKLAGFFEPVEIEEDGTYDVASLVVPVRDPEGAIVMSLRLRQLPAGASGDVVHGWIRALKDAAAVVERELGGGPAAADLEDYLAWYEADFPG